ncbi:MAG: flagellin FliC3 [Lachnospiraceae bacterium]|nr:flagellin FliC3 [Lachnospiraceae bacterium]MBO4823813.1 flagellin FliC3 [Lachnospiraceae bacterium]
MRINYNVSAMIANRTLGNNDKALSNSIERLSSGLKINHAKDNASGIAMAKRMRAQIRSLETANDNSNDGVSVIEIAEGALTEVEDMIQRMNELAVKACNGTLCDEDRKIIDEEITQLKAEIERIANTTMYNGSVLLNGDFDVKGYSDNDSLKVTTYTDDVRSGDYYINKLFAKFDDEGELIPEKISNIKEDLGNGSYILYDDTKAPEEMVEVPGMTFEYELGAGFPQGATATVKKDAIIVTGPKGFEMEFRVKENIDDTDGIYLDITGLGAMNVQIGTGEGQELGVRISTISLRTLGLEKVDCTTRENAEEFLAQMSDTLLYVNQARSRLGAYQNRLEHTISTLDISEENMTGAYSRIMDADMADEMTEYSKNQVLVQASTSMVAQANERPSSVLQLLQ